MKDKKRMAVIAVVVAAFFTVSAYSIIVDGFTMYNPPSTMYIAWTDYYIEQTGTPSPNNAVTGKSMWSAEFPYRAIFFGANYKSSSAYNSNVYIVYSKNPVVDIFTFTSMGIDRGYDDRNTKKGAIRATFAKGSWGRDKDVNIVQAGAGDIVKLNGQWVLGSGTPILGDCSNYPTYTMNGYNTVGNNVYFDFDFYYDCSAYHQTNAQSASINGLLSVSGVPYDYIVRCEHDENHNSSGGSGGSGGANQGGSGGESSGGSGGNPSSNNSGSGGRHGWGGGEYGGGVDRDDINSHSDGGGYPDRNDMELSVPDDWKDPIEDDYDGGFNSEYKPDYPEYIPAEGDTGNNGENWDLPGFEFDNDGVAGEIDGYKDFSPGGEYGLIDFLAPYK